MLGNILRQGHDTTKSNKPIEAMNYTEIESTEAIITLVGDNGSCCTCRILDTFDLEHWKYALLLKMDGDEEGVLVAMRVVQSDDRANFEAIEDDTEFDLVVMEIEKRTGISVREGTLGKHIF